MSAQKTEGKTMDTLKKSVIIFGTAVAITALALGDANAQNTAATPYINYLLQQNRNIDAILRTLPPDAVAEGRARGPAWNQAPPISQERVLRQLQVPFERMMQNDPSVRESERALWNALGGNVEFKRPGGGWGRLPISEVQPYTTYYGCPGIPQPIPGNDFRALGMGCVPLRQLR